MLKKVDIIVGLAWGDEGKGKIVNAICKKYDYVCRWNGGPNAGHTVYIKNKKYKTHIIPCGIFHDKKCIIGPNCVVNLDKFYDEIEYLKSNGFDTNLIKVSPRANIITERHIIYDKLYLNKKLGTTCQGIAPAYADKMLRRGKLAKDYIDKKYLWDETLNGEVLCEGAQSFWLDINYGNYPYVTSSETLPYSACSLGFNPKKIENIIGVAKAYDTKSGVDPLFPEILLDIPEFKKITEYGSEYGSTTGRKRLINWLRLDYLNNAINISGVNKLIINKCDILQSVGMYKLIVKNVTRTFHNLDEFKTYIKKYISKNKKIKILFSGDKEKL